MDSAPPCLVVSPMYTALHSSVPLDVKLNHRYPRLYITLSPSRLALNVTSKVTSLLIFHFRNSTPNYQHPQLTPLPTVLSLHFAMQSELTAEQHMLHHLRLFASDSTN